MASVVAPPAKPAPAPPKPKKRVVEEPAGGPPMPAPQAPEPKKVKTGLAVGDKLPDLTLLDEEGNSVQVGEITKEKGIILFAYPKASTPGCTKQVTFPWTYI
jgi:peroxiredoxin Q/BCP